MEKQTFYLLIRRFFARVLDYAIYNTVATLIINMLFRLTLVNLAKYGILITILAALLQIAIEPIIIIKYHTTLGKNILGISFKKKDNEKITYKDGLKWTAFATIFGYGFGMTTVSVLLALVHFFAYRKNGFTIWEYQSDLSLVDENIKPLRTIGFMAVFILNLFISVGLTVLMFNPINKGPQLTYAQFQENYNYFLQFIYGDGVSDIVDDYLTDEGKFSERDVEYSIDDKAVEMSIDFEYGKDDVISKIIYTINYEDIEDKGFEYFVNEDRKLTTAMYASNVMSNYAVSGEIKEILDGLAKDNKLDYENENATVKSSISNGVGTVIIEYK